MSGSYDGFIRYDEWENQGFPSIKGYPYITGSHHAHYKDREPIKSVSEQMFDMMYVNPAKVILPCQYCGQWGIISAPCRQCGGAIR